MPNTDKQPAKGAKPPQELSPEVIERLSRLRYLKTDEFAAVTRTSSKLIRKLIRTGRLRPVQGVKPYLLPNSQLAKFDGGAS